MYCRKVLLVPLYELHDQDDEKQRNKNESYKQQCRELEVACITKDQISRLIGEIRPYRGILIHSMRVPSARGSHDSRTRPLPRSNKAPTTPFPRYIR
jgi:hypothetical protein